MNCQCQGIEQEFNQTVAENDLKSYLKNGPQDTTRQLIEALSATGIEGLTLLDIGGGVGVIQYELLKAGVGHVTSVDASTAYLQAARREAARRNFTNQIDHIHGDFVSLASMVSSADIVTLDRVICCYHNMEDLVSRSSAHALRLYGVVFPRDTWWVKIGIALINIVSRLRRSPFRAFAHSTEKFEQILYRSGFEQRFYRHNLIWQVRVYSR